MQSFELNPDHIMQDVYSYPYPEVRKHIDGLYLPADFMLNTLPSEKALGMLASYQFSPELELPCNSDGSINLDEIHVPAITRITARNEAALPGLTGFNYAYPHHGSSQSLFTLMAEWKANATLQSIAILEGEYDGYKAYADSLRIPVEVYGTLSDTSPEQGQTWFVSNPSALDGNWIDADQWNEFLQQGHDVVVDAAYVGLTAEQQMDVSAPNIRAVLTSPSKIFGVFRYRNTGIAYTRQPVDAMYGTKWFKDIPALLATLSLYETFGPNQLPDAYRPVQKLLCQKLTALCDVEVSPSDVLLLGNAQETPKQPYDAFSRAKGYRFGLTKLFEDAEAAGIAKHNQESV